MGQRITAVDMWIVSYLTSSMPKRCPQLAPAQRYRSQQWSVPWQAHMSSEPTMVDEFAAYGPLKIRYGIIEVRIGFRVEI